jgi:stringent starvation protein B
MQEISTKPYLVRALYEWCTDNGFTPHIAVRVDAATRVPREFVRNGEIVLNISFTATSQLQMGNEWIEFTARFSGRAHKIEVPVANVLAIYARENGQGMAFQVDETAGDEGELVDDAVAFAAAEAAEVADGEAQEHAAAAHHEPAEPESHPDGDGPKGGGRGHLKVVK